MTERTTTRGARTARRTLCIATLLLGAVTAPTTARAVEVAVPAPAAASAPAPAASANAAKQQLKEAEEHLKKARQDLNGAIRDGGSADTIKRLDKEVAAAAAQVEEARRAAKQAEREHLAKKGYAISPLKLRGEWTKHARRVARLKRIRELAVEAKDDAAVARVDQLLAKESGRHDHWIDKEHASATSPGGSASGAPAAAPKDGGGK